MNNLSHYIVLKGYNLVREKCFSKREKIRSSYILCNHLTTNRFRAVIYRSVAGSWLFAKRRKEL